MFLFSGSNNGKKIGHQYLDCALAMPFSKKNQISIPNALSVRHNLIKMMKTRYTENLECACVIQMKQIQRDYRRYHQQKLVVYRLKKKKKTNKQKNYVRTSA